MTFRLRELLKDIVIVLLLLSIFLLTLMALPASSVSTLALPDRLAQFLGVSAPSRYTPSDTAQMSAAALPLAISVRNDGGRHTVRGEIEILDAVFGSLDEHLGQALATARNPRAMDESDFYAAMEHRSVLFIFGGSIPSRALCSWITGSIGGVDLSASDFLLVPEGDTVSLLLLGSRPTRYDTDADASSLSALLDEYTPDGTEFAAVLDSSLHPLTLWENSISLPACLTENPVTSEYATQLATALEFNPYGAGVYTDPAGNISYSETERTLTVATDGRVTLSFSQPEQSPYTAQEDTEASRIETARQLLNTIAGTVSGDAQIFLHSCREDSGQVTCAFQYVLAGIPVAPVCAEAVFSGQTLTELTVTLRTFHIVSGVRQLMPLSAAAAIAGEGDRLAPAYSMSGTPGWYRIGN